VHDNYNNVTNYSRRFHATYSGRTGKRRSRRQVVAEIFYVPVITEEHQNVTERWRLQPDSVRKINKNKKNTRLL
jgi:hypothetical protein